YHSLPAAMLITLVLLFLIAFAGAGRSMLRDPLRRATFIGVPATVAIFVIASPHHEVRYLFPLLPLIFAAAGFAIVRWLPWEVGRVVAAVVLLDIALATSFEPGLLRHVFEYAAIG